MTRACCFHDDTGEHKFDDSCFPVTIGGIDADITLPSVSISDGTAYVDFSEGHPFIQPDERSRVFLNRKKLVQSGWLSNGDIIRLGRSSLICEIDRQLITFRIIPNATDKKRVLEPPSTSPRGRVSPPVVDRHNIKKAAVVTRKKPKKLRLGTVLLSTFFIVLLFLVGFVFSAAPVTVKVVPKPDSLAMEGNLWAIKLGNHFLVWPGEYRVKAEKQGYIRLDKKVEIGRNSAGSLAYELEKLGGILMLTSTPVNQAEVFIDDQKAGQTPLANIQVTPGRHRIVFRHPRYQEDLQEIDVEGEGKKQQITGRLIPNWAAVEMLSEPSAAIVKINGEERGKTPLTLDLLAGKHKIRIEKSGFENWESEIEVVAGQDRKLPQVELAKAPGQLQLSTRPAGASVVVDEQFRGRTPIKLKLKPEQKHTITLFKAGYAEVKRTVELGSGEAKLLSIDLTEIYGEIELVGVPSDATLFIDGKNKGGVSGKLRLSTRDHQLEISKKGFKSFKKTVTPRQGFTQQIKVNLVSSEDTPKTIKGLAAPGTSSLIYVKPGRFTMGASRREQGRRSNEVLHEVQLTRPFYIAKTEVTNAEFRKFKPDHSSGNSRGLSLDGNKHPVVNVSWNDAARYCNWLSEQQNLQPVYAEKGGVMVARKPVTNGYRLPSEAEWAWAARSAGRTRPLKYPWGASFPATANSGNYGTGDSYVITAPVAGFKPGNLGLYDIGGNVSEWMHDYYSVFTGFDKKLLRDPMGPDTGKHHVVRGSSWRHDSITELRLSYRDYSSKSRDDVGFRVARYAD